MKGLRVHALWRSIQYALVGGALMGVLTFLCFVSGLGLTVAAPVYLLIIVLLSLTGDFLSAALISALAAACLDYFFTEPLYAFRMSRPSDVFALGSFLMTGLIITQLVSRLRVEMQNTKTQKERLDHLYQLSQQLVALGPDETDERFLEPFQRLFGVTAITLFDGRTGESRIAGSSRNRLAEKTRDAYISGSDSSDASAGVSVRCLRLGGKVSGAIGFESLQDPEETVGPLAALTSAHLEKIRAFRDASAASAAAQTEVYRSAILDALAHEFKTPLATILAAAGGIREAGSLGPEQSEMAETVESEAERLGRLTSRLLRVARLDREEVRPRIELLDLDSVVRHMVAQYAQRWPDRQISLTNRADAAEERADPELFRMAVSQLLDNACKYSAPGSIVRVALDRDPNGVFVEVSNTGSSIPMAEQRRIFDRFYRGSETKQNTAGTGLGLYVARKIALAHGGNLELVPGQENSNEVTFRLKIPSAHVPADHAFTAK